MYLFKEMAIILGIALVGVILAEFSPLAVSGSVLGMVILLILLMKNVVKLEQISTFGNFLTANMVVFFISPGAAFVDYYPVFQDVLLEILFICIFTSVLVFGVTAYTVILVTKFQERRGVKSNG